MNQSQPPAPSVPAPAHKKKKWLVLLPVGLAAVLMLLLAMLPALAASAPARKIILSYANEAIPGSIAVESLSLSWFGSEKISGLKLMDPQGLTVLSVREASTELSIWDALRGHFDLGQVRITGVEGNIVADENGSNLMRALVDPDKEKTPSTEPTRLPQSLKANLTLEDVKVTISGPAVNAPVTISDVKSQVVLGGAGQPVTLQLSARSTQGNLSGELQAQGKIENLIAADGTLDLEKFTADIQATTQGLPSDGLDGMLGMRGVLSAALGKSLDLNIAAQGNAAELNATVKATSPNLNADLQARIAQTRQVTLTQPGKVAFTATPELVDLLARGGGEAVKMKLKNAVTFNLLAEKLQLDTANLSTASVTAAISADKPIELTGDPTLGDVRIRNLSAQVDSARLSDAVKLALKADVDTTGGPGQLLADAQVKNLFDAAGQPQFDKLTADAVARVNNVPTALLDRIASLEGQLVEALGPTANVSAVVVTASDGSLTLTLNSDTQNLEIENATLQLAGGQITLIKPAQVRYTLSPPLANRYLALVPVRPTTPFAQDTFTVFVSTETHCEPPTPAAATLTLAAPVALSLQLDKFTMPLPGGEPNAKPFIPSKTALAATLNIASIQLDGVPTLGRAAVEGLQVELAGDSLAQMQLTGSATLHDGQQAGMITQLAGGSLPIVLSAQTGLSDENKLTDIALQLKAVSSNLKTELAAKLTNNLKNLSVAPSTLSLTASPELLAQLGINLEGPLADVGPVAMAVNIKQIEMPLGGAASLDAIQLASDVSIRASSDRDPLAVALGRDVNLTLATEPIQGEAKPLKLTARSQNLNADLAAKITQKDGRLQLALTQPGTVNLTATNEALALIGQQPLLASPTPVELSLSTLSATVSPFAINTVQLQGVAKLPRAELAGEGDLKGAAISDTTATLAFEGARGSATLKLDGKASAPGQSQPGPLTADIAASNLLNKEGAFDTAAATVEVKALKLQGLPTSFVDALAGQQGKLVALAGPTLDITATASLANLSQPRGTAEATVKSSNLNADASLKLAEMIEATRPIKVNLKLTPEAFAALTKPAPSTSPAATPAPAPIQLTRPADVSLTVNTLRYPMAGGPFDPARAAVDASLSIPQMQMLDPASKQNVSLHNLAATLKAPSLAQPLALQANAEIRSGQETGKLLVSGSLADLFTAEGKPNTAALSADLTASLAKFPVGLADALLKQEGMLLAALGASLNADATVKLNKMQGPVTLALNSTSAQASIKALLDSQWLTLSEPMTADLTVSPELSTKLFARVSPFFKGISKEDGPVKLLIPHEGFRVPVNGFDIEKITIPMASLDLGKARLQNDSLVKLTMAALKQGGGQEMDAWFTPAVLSVEGGYVRFTRRVDFLLNNNLHLALWGEADLRTTDGQESQYVQTLGLTEQVLAKSFGIDGLPKGEMMRVPVRGTSSKPEIDFSRTLTDLGKLQAQSRLAKLNPLAGAVLNTLIKEALGGPPIPPASADPLPWAKVALPTTSTDPAAPTNALNPTATSPTPAPAPAPKQATQPAAQPKPATTTEPAPAPTPKKQAEPKEDTPTKKEQRKAKQQAEEAEPTEEDSTKKKRQQKKQQDQAEEPSILPNLP